jgi:hypothetical protein
MVLISARFTPVWQLVLRSARELDAFPLYIAF